MRRLVMLWLHVVFAYTRRSNVHGGRATDERGTRRSTIHGFLAAA
jgi:hypothetical protein